MSSDRPVGRPPDDDAAWAAIVASLSADGVGQSPAPAQPEPEPEVVEVEPEPWLDQTEAAELRADAEAEIDRLLPEEHFVPPEPPPIPRGDMVSRLAWGGVLGGPGALLLATLLSLSPPTWLVGFAVLAFVAGFVTLVARMRSSDDPPAPNGGAVV